MMPKWSSYWEMAQNDARADMRTAAALQNAAELRLSGARDIVTAMTGAGPPKDAPLPPLPDSTPDLYRGGASRCATCGHRLELEREPSRPPSEVLQVGLSTVSAVAGGIAVVFHELSAGAVGIIFGVSSLFLFISRHLDRIEQRHP